MKKIIPLLNCAISLSVPTLLVASSCSQQYISVNFILDNGEESITIKTPKGSPVSEPNQPYKKFWIFDGWYKDKEYKDKFDFSEKIQDDLTLYAKWLYPSDGSMIWESFDNDEPFGLDIFKETLRMTHLTSTEKDDFLFWKSNQFGANFDDWYKTISGAGVYEYQTETISGNEFVILNEAKSIFMYANINPYDINGPLHNRKEPDPVSQKYHFENIPNTSFTGDYWVNNVQIYKLMDQALSRGVSPFDFTCYHGVEFVEDEILPQIKDYINIDPEKGIYDVKNCIGQSFKMYGYTSCAMNPWWCANFLYDTTKRPEEQDKSVLKMPSLCKIKVPKGKTCIYINHFPLMQNLARTDLETQTIIKRNTTFIIEDAKIIELPYTHWCKISTPIGVDPSQKFYKAFYLTLRVGDQE